MAPRKTSAPVDPGAPPPDLELPPLEGAPPEFIDHPERYELDADGLAWAMRGLARARRAVAYVEAQRRLAAARIDAWHDDRAAGPKRAAAAAEAAIKAHALRLRAERDIKTTTTPWGVVKTQGQGDQLPTDDAVYLDGVFERAGWIVAHEADVEALESEPRPRLVLESCGRLGAGPLLAALEAALAPWARIEVSIDRAELRRRATVVPRTDDGYRVAEGPDGALYAVHEDGEVVRAVEPADVHLVVEDKLGGGPIVGVTAVPSEPSVTIKVEDPATWVPNPVAGLARLAFQECGADPGDTRDYPAGTTSCDLPVGHEGRHHARWPDGDGEITWPGGDAGAGPVDGDEEPSEVPA